MVGRLQHLKQLWSGHVSSEQYKLGDLHVMLAAIGATEYSGATHGFCTVNCLR